MKARSVLIVGGSVAARTIAGALAQLGIDVSLIHRASEPTDADASEPFGAFSNAGVEIRAGIDLVGVLDVDSHIEVELSNSRVENYDAVVITDAVAAMRLDGDGRASTRVEIVDGPCDVPGAVERASALGGSAAN